DRVMGFRCQRRDIDRSAREPGSDEERAQRDPEGGHDGGIPSARAHGAQRGRVQRRFLRLRGGSRYSLRRMRYEYTREQLAWRDEVRAFCEANVTDALRAELRLAGNEGDGPLARAFHRRLFEQGWWGVGWPKEFGGMGKAAVEQYIFIDEMQMAGAPAMNLSITSVAPTILREGTDAQKATWLPRILRGEIEFAVAYSEPNAGTDLAALSTRAELVGDEWVINGQKIWNTGAHTATHNWVAVRTEPEARKHQGISMIIVPMNTPGIEVQGIWTMSNIRTNAVFFDDVRVPKDHLIGQRGM